MGDAICSTKDCECDAFAHKWGSVLDYAWRCENHTAGLLSDEVLVAEAHRRGLVNVGAVEGVSAMDVMQEQEKVGDI